MVYQLLIRVAQHRLYKLDSMNALFLFLILLITGCNNDRIPSKPDSHQVSNSIEKDVRGFYKYEDEYIVQTLHVKFLSKTQMEFVLASESKKAREVSEIAGTAINSGGDYEIDEDEEGNAYPVVEYIFDNNCWLSFRFDADTKTKLRITETNCEDSRKPECPFGSGAMFLKKVR